MVREDEKLMGGFGPLRSIAGRMECRLFDIVKELRLRAHIGDYLMAFPLSLHHRRVKLDEICCYRDTLTHHHVEARLSTELSQIQFGPKWVSAQQLLTTQALNTDDAKYFHSRVTRSHCGSSA